MDTLSDDIQNIIYKYKHQIEFKSVINELNKCVDLWCEMNLDNSRYIYFSNELKSLNDYEEHLFINLRSNDIIDIINENY